MTIYELILDEMEETGIEAISLVESPAIESNFIALNSQKPKPIKFSTVDSEQRIVMGPALIPNKPIYRFMDNEEFYVFFSKKTVRMASEWYLKHGNQKNANIEHSTDMLDGITLSETWIKEDMEKDKSAIYGMNDPVGTWMASMKIDNEEVWTDYVKTGLVQGFSIEGFFADKGASKFTQKAKALKEAQEPLKNHLSKSELLKHLAKINIKK